MKRALSLGSSRRKEPEKARARTYLTPSDTILAAGANAGVEFIAENGGGPGVRLRSKPNLLALAHLAGAAARRAGRPDLGAGQEIEGPPIKRGPSVQLHLTLRSRKENHHRRAEDRAKMNRAP